MARTIAIVEDDPDQRANYADAITMKGYQVNAYASREEASAACVAEGWTSRSRLGETVGHVGQRFFLHCTIH